MGILKLPAKTGELHFQGIGPYSGNAITSCFPISGEFSDLGAKKTPLSILAAHPEIGKLPRGRKALHLGSLRYQVRLRCQESCGFAGWGAQPRRRNTVGSE